MTSDTPSLANVLAVYNGATGDQIRWGLQWYFDAHNFALTLGGGRAWHLSRNAGIVAALSPMNKWDNNKRKAAELVSKRGRVPTGRGVANGIGLGNNVAKAVAIYKGAEPLDVLGGDKVRAFYQTILDPTADIDPVIDRHAFDIAVGEVTNEKRRGILSRKGVYHDFARVYREAAKVAGVGASQMQAITWVAWREAIGIDD